MKQKPKFIAACEIYEVEKNVFTALNTNIPIVLEEFLGD